jgi:hypothetical protein
MDAETLSEFGKCRTQMRFDSFRTPDKNYSGFTVGPQKMQGGRYGHRRAVIAPHAVNSEGDSHSAQE